VAVRELSGEVRGGAIGEGRAVEPRAVRAAPGAIAMEDVRARAERALFGVAERARLGRFVLIGPLAGGGMGIVYSAYDPELDRRVALKLIYPDRRGPAGARAQLIAEARAQLIAEARARARLDHPNVVPIHDVLEIDDQVVLVMELVAGQTLAAWERARPRAWREIVATYAAAGRGLAAVHRLGLVHRDFKPGSSIIGDDGRVRVLDFGLALAATGDVSGAIGFLAPEQLRGGTATAASDQFSFCVALHRALHGAPPFAGATSAELLSSIEAGQIEVGPGAARAPGWLRAVLARGLAADPAARFSSMEHLLAELGRARGLRRWRAPAAATTAFAATAFAVVALARPASDSLAACDGGAGEVGAIWGPVRRARAGARIEAAGTPLARAAGELVLGALDGYRDAWIHQHRDACVAHHRGTQPERVIEQRLLCLRRRLGDLAGAADAIEGLDRASIGDAVDVAVKLPPVADCGDLAPIERERQREREREREPPATPGD
jgi:eukaryotic-like serine/threonine-protein kinase